MEPGPVAEVTGLGFGHYSHAQRRNEKSYRSIPRNLFMHTKLRAEGARHISPGQRPGVASPQMRGALKGRDIKYHSARCLWSGVTPFQGLFFSIYPFPGRCPGLIFNDLSGLKPYYFLEPCLRVIMVENSKKANLIFRHLLICYFLLIII